MICSKCNNKISDTDQFCPVCGTNINTNKEKLLNILKKYKFYIALSIGVILIMTFFLILNYLKRDQKSNNILNNVQTVKTKIFEPIDINISQIDTSDYPRVKIFFTAYDKNNNELTKLSNSDITIKEFINGQNKSVDNKILSLKYLDIKDKTNICLVMDTSNSMNEENRIYDAKESAINFLEQIKTDNEDKIALMEFNEQQYLIEYFTDDKNRLIQGVNNLSAYGSMTALYDSLKSALLQIKNLSGQKFIIAFTDGQDNASIISYDEVIKISRELGIPIYIIGIGNDINTTPLEEIAIKSGGKYFLTQNAKELKNIYDSIYDIQNRQYLLTYETKDKDNLNVWRKIVLDIKNNNYHGNTEREYIPKSSYENSIIIYDENIPVEASSYHIEKGENGLRIYKPENIIDNDPQTAWVEDDKKGYGVGEWIKINFNDLQTLNGIRINNGYKKQYPNKSKDYLYFANARVKKINVEFSNGESFIYDLKDDFYNVDDLKFINPKTTTYVKFTILEVYPGEKYDDTCISDINFY